MTTHLANRAVIRNCQELLISIAAIAASATLFGMPAWLAPAFAIVIAIPITYFHAARLFTRSSSTS